MAKKMKGGNAAIALIPFIIGFIGVLMIVLWQTGVFSPKPSTPPVPASKPGGRISS